MNEGEKNKKRIIRATSGRIETDDPPTVAPFGRDWLRVEEREKELRVAKRR